VAIETASESISTLSDDDFAELVPGCKPISGNS
jgi:hypothetical protein